jgi:hypothetical protein
VLPRASYPYYPIVDTFLLFWYNFPSLVVFFGVNMHTEIDMPEGQNIEIVTGVNVVNYHTEDKVISVIKEAKLKGWQLFPKEQLAQNAQEWLATLEEGLKGTPREWLSAAKDAAEFLPLVHLIDPGYLKEIVKQGHIPSLVLRGGKGRTARYEQELGLGDYVFLSTPNWITPAGGVPIYFRPSPILEREGTVVTLFDILILNGFPFDERVKFYQKTALSGKDFQKLLPYFLVAHYGDINRPYEVPHPVYPKWFREKLRRGAFFQPEIKVKDQLELAADCRLAFSEKNRYSWGKGTKLTDEDTDFIKTAFEGRTVDWLQGRIDIATQKGREWWQK